MGKHFEGLGSQWNVFMKTKEKKFADLVEMVFSKGKITTYPLHYSTSEDIDSALRCGVYPHNTIAQIAILLHTQKEKSANIISAFPLLQGYRNQLKIDNTYTWNSDFEGDVNAVWNNEIDTTFFNPFYYLDFKSLNTKKIQNICLAGLAYEISKSPDQKWTIDRGGLYEMQLKRFIQKHPNKTKDDFPLPVVYLGDCTIFIPTKYATDYTFRGHILNLNTISLLGNKITKMNIRLASNLKYSNRDFIISLYANKEVLGEYKPKIGDNIDGTLWLYGYIDRHSHKSNVTKKNNLLKNKLSIDVCVKKGESYYRIERKKVFYPLTYEQALQQSVKKGFDLLCVKEYENLDVAGHCTLRQAIDWLCCERHPVNTTMFPIDDVMNFDFLSKQKLTTVEKKQKNALLKLLKVGRDGKLVFYGFEGNIKTFKDKNDGYDRINTELIDIKRLYKPQEPTLHTEVYLKIDELYSFYLIFVDTKQMFNIFPPKHLTLPIQRFMENKQEE
ncbi:MAG: hypothetical protein LBT79_00160 [Elusimicrobiota bacterium]|jgi:hypothetical protein|nr:hypothetical protein [Elusimicrobiota bacterium]